MGLVIVAVVDDDAFEVAGEHDDRLGGIATSLYIRSNRLSSSLGSSEVIVAFASISSQRYVLGFQQYKSSWAFTLLSIKNITFLFGAL